MKTSAMPNGDGPTTYGRLDQTPRAETDGFEHLNNFVLFNDGRKVMVKAIRSQEALTSNLVQCCRLPLSPDCRYYRMTVKEIDDGQFVMFGLTNKCLPGFPLWTIDRSVRYHSNDGGVFNGGLGIRTYHPYGCGDTVTCRLDYVGPDRSLINFLLNDRFVYRQWVNLPPDQLYATVGLSRTAAQLDMEWPQPGRGDITIRNDLPSNWFGWTGITRDNEAMTFTLTRPDSKDREAYNVQCPLAISKHFHYFEIEVLKKSSYEHGQGIGLVSGNCEAFVYPGWMPQTIGYHNDDGGLYVNGENSEPKDKFRCVAGDRMGCGVVFPKDVRSSSEREPILVLVYFTRNGQLAYTKRMRQPRGGFFPCIALYEKDDSVRLDVNAEPPEFPGVDLAKVLTTSEASQDYRCNEAFRLADLTHHSATVQMPADTDTAQLLQFRAEPLRHLGDCFTIEVTQFGQSTEIQMGVSTEGSRLEGEFLGAENTSCGYMLKLGSIVSKDGMRAVAKWDPEKKQKIACYLDYIDDGGAVLCFTVNERLIGRGVVSRATGCNLAIYASIVISAGPAEVKADWTGILNSTKIVRTRRNAEDWIRASCVEAKGDNFELKPFEGYAFAASAQSTQPLVTGSSVFSVKLQSGQDLPGIGLSRATHDVNNVLGSESGEICFVPSGPHILVNNAKRSVQSAPEIQPGDILQCGVVFSRPADRVPQKVVVYFALNSVVFHHCRLQAAYGGLYPTVAFSSTGGSVQVVPGQTVLPVPDEISSLWLSEKSSTDIHGDLNGIPALSSSSYPHHHHNDGDGRKMSVVQPLETATPTDVTKVKVYASHAFGDREMVEGVMKQLQSSQPYVALETSTSRACMADKHEALSKADLVVLFVSDNYYSSHEMLTEYTNIIRKKELPAVLCALDNKGWPPHTYFRELEEELSKLSWVELTLRGQQGRPSTGPLERYIQHKFAQRLGSQQSSNQEEFNHASKSASKRATQKAETDQKVKAKSSMTCHIL
ncbi:uncharacterized protein LOC143280992 [Babylonia areolata]|uniref:uncharacterized protein LOC143280992 n=1 Tax=Babylonia areolata TaxID=304850 RepID=UPI003FD5FA31